MVVVCVSLLGVSVRLCCVSCHTHTHAHTAHHTPHNAHTSPTTTRHPSVVLAEHHRFHGGQVIRGGWYRETRCQNGDSWCVCVHTDSRAACTRATNAPQMHTHTHTHTRCTNTRTTPKPHKRLPHQIPSHTYTHTHTHTYTPYQCLVRRCRRSR